MPEFREGTSIAVIIHDPEAGAEKTVNNWLAKFEKETHAAGYISIIKSATVNDRYTTILYTLMDDLSFHSPM